MVEVPDGEIIPLTTGDDCQLELRRHPGNGNLPGRGDSVLLVHGASAASDTFRVGEEQPIVAYLQQNGFSVWALDWRASMHCVERVHSKHHDRNDIFTIDAAAKHDVPAAITSMRSRGVRGKIGIVAHCLGGGMVAQGIAEGAILPSDVENVVLTGLGLFYKPALDTLLKAEDHPLEDLLARHVDLLHPEKKWPSNETSDCIWDALLETPYKVWLQTPMKHDCNDDFCHRLSYLFGMPYVPSKIKTVHDHLRSQFGYISTQFLLHCAQNLRRGYAGKYEPQFEQAQNVPFRFKAESFRDRKLSLITGDVNCLWHRDSIDTMYEWLLRAPKSDRPRWMRKHVIPSFAHQDLLWGTGAPKDVFGYILKGLRD